MEQTCNLCALQHTCPKAGNFENYSWISSGCIDFKLKTPIKKEAQTLSWKVKIFDINSQRIKDYDILKGHYKDFVKDLKKKCATKEEFSKAMDREMMWMFWSRSEYELILELDENNHIWLEPWVGCREPENVRIDVTADTSFDWQGFLKTLTLNYQNCEKIDIYDQLKYRWDDFVTYLWTTRQKYERWHPKFEA